MPAVQFPTGFFPNAELAGVLGLGSVYIGTVGTNPRTLANRIDVTVIQENGTPVVIPPASQPFVLSAGGVFEYQGSPVRLTVASNYSMAVDTQDDVQAFYFPSVAAGDVAEFSSISLPVLDSDPDPIADTGQIYTKLAAGIAEFFYMDSDGNVIQFTENGQIKVTLGDSVIEALQLIAEETVTGTQFQGDPITLTIVGGDVELDLQLGLNYYLELDEAVDTFSFTNAPTIRIPNITLKINNTGAFDITTFSFTAMGGVVQVPDTFDGSLSPTHSAVTDYGIALFPGPILSIYPVLMKVYVP